MTFKFFIKPTIALCAIFAFSISAFGFNEKQLIKSMNAHKFSASLISTTIDIARDLKDKTGCFQISKTHPKKNRILACEYATQNRSQSQCHLVNLKNNKIQSGYVAFGKNGISNGPQPGTSKTALGIYTLNKNIKKTASKAKDLGASFASQVVRHDGRIDKNKLGLVYYPNTAKKFKQSGGSPAVFGDFAKAVLKQARSTVLINHSLEVPYDNACGNLQARKNYSSDKGIAKTFERGYDSKSQKKQDPLKATPNQNSGRMPASFSQPKFAD